MHLSNRSLSLFLCCSLVLASAPRAIGQADQVAATPVQAAQQTPEQLQQLVAPIALYPDALVAQILAASTYPDQVVEADRWMQQHTNLQGDQLGQEVNKQPWDPSVKALTEFPSVLANMDKNLSWTSSLGDAYFNQQQALMDAVQEMRRDAENSGNLRSTAQQTVTTQGQTIIIQPANPETVYVPEYDPWLVYGTPIGVWPGWYSYPGLFIGGPGLYFGTGFGIGFFGGYGWGWHNWNPDWRHHTIDYNHNTYISHSRTFANRNNFGHGRGDLNHAGGFGGHSGFHGSAGSHNGFGAQQHGSFGSHAQPGGHASAFSGFNHGGVTHGFSSHGQSSFGGGFHGGGGGFHGGGGGHGGGHH